MIRVIFDWDVYYESLGGGYRTFCELVKRLSSLEDFEVDFLASKISSNLLPIKKAPIKTRITPSISGTFPLRYIFSYIRRKIDSFYCKAQIGRELKNTIFHSPYYSICPNPKIPQVSTIYDFIIEKFFLKPGTDSFKDFVEQKKRAILNSRRLIAISEKTKDDLKEFYNPPDEIIDVIHLGVDSNFFSFPSDETSSKIFLNRNEITVPFILHVGGRLNHKNFERLIKAFGKSPLKNEFLLVSAGYKWTPEELLLIKTLGIEENVRLVLKPNDEELRILYQNARIFAYPSYYEGFGLPPLEAMAAGAPVVASRGGSIPEIVGEGALLFDPFNIDDIASKLEEMTSSEISSTYIRKGKERVKLFSWDTITQKIIESYRKTLS